MLPHTLARVVATNTIATTRASRLTTVAMETSRADAPAIQVTAFAAILTCAVVFTVLAVRAEWALLQASEEDRMKQNKYLSAKEK